MPEVASSNAIHMHHQCLYLQAFTIDKINNTNIFYVASKSFRLYVNVASSTLPFLFHLRVLCGIALLHHVIVHIKEKIKRQQVRESLLLYPPDVTSGNVNHLLQFITCTLWLIVSQAGYCAQIFFPHILQVNGASLECTLM